MNLLKIMLISILLSVTGCASIVSDSTYPVTVDADEGQKYTVRKENGDRVRTATGNKTFTLRAGKNFNCYDYTVETDCGKTPIDAGLDGWLLGNILLGGIIGLIVDPMTGAACTLPEHVSIPSCIAAPVTEAGE